MAAAMFHGTGPPGRRGHLGRLQAALAAARHDASRACSSRWRCSAPARTRRSPARSPGQIVMEGFLNIRLRPWLRRLITRLHRHHSGDHRRRDRTASAGTGRAARSSARSSSASSCRSRCFRSSCSRAIGAKMGDFVSPLWMRALAWTTALVIAVLNVWLLYQTFARAVDSSPCTGASSSPSSTRRRTGRSSSTSRRSRG